MADHLPMHCTFTFDERQTNDPIFRRKVSQMDCTRFKELINDRVSTLTHTFETARELDSIAELLPVIVREAFEASCPQREVINRRRPVSPMILELIKEKRKLRRQKSRAHVMGDSDQVQSIQRKMNLVGNRIKKEQKMEQRRRHEVACQKLSSENNPRKFFQSVKTLT